MGNRTKCLNVDEEDEEEDAFVKEAEQRAKAKATAMAIQIKGEKYRLGNNGNIRWKNDDNFVKRAELEAKERAKKATEETSKFNMNKDYKLQSRTDNHESKAS